MSGQTSITATKFMDATETPVPVGSKVCFQPCDPITRTPLGAYHAGGTNAGTRSGKPVSVSVTTAGQFNISLDDGALTTPLNIGYLVTAKDNVGRALLGSGYVIQPNGASWSFDSDWDPDATPYGMVQIGPAGAAGQSAYQLWLAAGNTGTVQDFLASLSTVAAQTQTIGASGLASPITGTQGALCCVNTPTTLSGLVSSFSMFCPNAAGTTFDLVVATKDQANGTATIVSRTTVSVKTGNAVNTFVNGTDFTSPTVAVGQYLGYAVVSPNEYVLASATTPNLFYCNNNPAVGTTTAVTTANLNLDFSATVTQTVVSNFASTAQVQAAILPVKTNTNANRTTLLDVSNFAAVSDAVTVGAAWSLSSAGATSPSTGQGYGNQLYLAAAFALYKRTTRFVFEVLASGTVAGFGFLQNGNAFGSLFVVDGSANTLNICNGWSGSGNPGVVASTALGFSLTAGQKYVLTVALNYRQVTVSLADPVSGATASVSAGNNATDKDGEVFGLMVDYPVLVNIAGQFRVDRLKVLANSVRPHVAFLGDSITYGFGNSSAPTYVLANTWAYQLAQMIGPQTTISGRPGGTTDSVTARIASEWAFLQPDVGVIMIGTNDAAQGVSASTYATKMQSIVAAARQCCQKLIVMTLPPCSIVTQSVIDSYNAALLALSGVDGFIRVDLAITPANVSSMTVDGTHPNAAGSTAIVNRAIGPDTPWILD